MQLFVIYSIGYIIPPTGLLISDSHYTALAKITKDYIFLQLSTKDRQRRSIAVSLAVYLQWFWKKCTANPQ